VAYFKKIVFAVEAWQWDGTTECLAMLENVTGKVFEADFTQNPAPIFVRVKGMKARCDVGDWVVRGIHGEYYPCSSHVFRDSYKEISKQEALDIAANQIGDEDVDSRI
jgi:hypothetical protein